LPVVATQEIGDRPDEGRKIRFAHKLAVYLMLQDRFGDRPCGQ
jgi:hypothetical protein